jgi:hypothetical protein
MVVYDSPLLSGEGAYAMVHIKKGTCGLPASPGTCLIPRPISFYASPGFADAHTSHECTPLRGGDVGKKNERGTWVYVMRSSTTHEPRHDTRNDMGPLSPMANQPTKLEAAHSAAHYGLNPFASSEFEHVRGEGHATHVVQGHGPGLHPARGDERSRRASRQRQGPRAFLEAPLMARRNQAHKRQRCLRPSALGDVCLSTVLVP